MRKPRSVGRTWGVVAASMMLILTACGAEDQDDGSESSEEVADDDSAQVDDGDSAQDDQDEVSEADGDPIVVGQLLPRTGGLADLGTRVGRGAEVARMMFNEAGGVDGRPIEWNSVDAPDDEAARQGAERLINAGVDVVYGTYGSSLALAAAPVVVRAGGVYWEEGASTAELTEQGWDGLFRISAIAPTLGVDAVNFAATVVADELGVEAADLTVGWAGVEASYGQDVLGGVEEAAGEHGMEIVVSLSYPVDATDLSTVARQIQQADPDILVLTNYPADAAALGRALREADFEADAIIGTGGGHADPSWVEAMDDAHEGFFNIGTVPQIDPTGLLPEAQERQQAFLDRYEDEYGEEPEGFDRMGFDGAWLLFQVIEQAGGTDPDAVKAATYELDLPMRSLLSGDGAMFNETGQNERVAWFTTQWQDGSLVPVAPDDLATGEPILIPLPSLGSS